MCESMDRKNTLYFLFPFHIFSKLQLCWLKRKLGFCATKKVRQTDRITRESLFSINLLFIGILCNMYIHTIAFFCIFQIEKELDLLIPWNLRPVPHRMYLFSIQIMIATHWDFKIFRYSKASRYTALRSTDLGDTRF